MRRTVERLGSMGLATTIIAALLLWLAWGIFLNARQDFADDFQTMTETFLRDWISSRVTGSLLKSWFIGLCMLMVLLGINLVLCTWLRIYKVLHSNFNGSKFLMLVVHMVFGLVAVGHLAGFTIGYRHEGLRLAEGEAFRTSDGYDVKLERIHFVRNPSAPSVSGVRLTPPDTRDAVSYADVSVASAGRVVAAARTQVMDPLRFRDLQITLRGFSRSLPSKSPSPSSSGQLKAVLVVSKNPTLRVFLALYPLMIAGILLHLVMTWRRKPASVSGRESQALRAPGSAV